MGGVVYTLNEFNEIIAEQKMDFNKAVFEYLGKRDSKGNRYHVTVEDKEVPFKWKAKKLITVNPQPANSEESNLQQSS